MTYAWLDHLAHCLDLAAQRQQQMALAPGNGTRAKKGMGMNGGPSVQKDALKPVLDEILGLFTSSGVVKLRMRDVGTVVDLLCEIIDDLELIAKEKGGLGQLLYKKRCKLYKVGSVRAYRRIQTA